MAAAGDKLRAHVLDDSQGTEPVILQLEDPVRVIDRQRSIHKRHWLEQNQK
jgi:hypothetical protein